MNIRFYLTYISKSGSPSVVSNYRPIFIQSHVSKMFEHWVLNAIQPTVNSILAGEQHGFHLRRSSTIYHLVIFTLGLSLNLDKCKIMTFTRSRSPLMSPYFINNAAVTRAMDLGFKLSCNLDPTAHIESVCCKALKTLTLLVLLCD